MKLNDAIFGLVLLALGATVLVSVQSFPKIPGQPVGPALFPGLIAAGLCIAGFLLIVHGVRDRVSQPWLVWDDWVRSPRHVVALLILLGAIVFYIVASDRLGFIPTAVVILVALLSALRVPLWRAVLIAVIAAVAVHFAFYKLLRVPLPWGVFEQYAF